MSLGHSIKMLRKNKGLTLAELADKINSHVGNLSRIERGIAKPSLDLLYRIADALEYELSDIFKVADNSNHNERQSALNALFISLVDQDQELLVEFAALLKKRQQKDSNMISVDMHNQPHHAESDDSMDDQDKSNKRKD